MFGAVGQMRRNTGDPGRRGQYAGAWAKRIVTATIASYAEVPGVGVIEPF
jgi:hypothetical protein